MGLLASPDYTAVISTFPYALCSVEGGGPASVCGSQAVRACSNGGFSADFFATGPQTSLLGQFGLKKWLIVDSCENLTLARCLLLPRAAPTVLPRVHKYCIVLMGLLLWLCASQKSTSKYSSIRQGHAPFQLVCSWICRAICEMALYQYVV